MRFNKSRAIDLIRQGRLLQAALLDGEGMIVDTVGERYDPERLASVYFSSKTYAGELERDLELGRTLEISFRSENQRMRLNVKHVGADGENLTLICLVPLPSLRLPSLKELLMDEEF